MSSSATGDSSSFPSPFNDIIHKFDQLDKKITNIGRPNSCPKDEVNNEINKLVDEIIDFSQTSYSEADKNKLLQNLNVMNVVLKNTSSHLDPSIFSDFINNATSSIRQAQEALNRQPVVSPSSSSSSSTSGPSWIAGTRSSPPVRPARPDRPLGAAVSPPPERIIKGLNVPLLPEGTKLGYVHAKAYLPLNVRKEVEECAKLFAEISTAGPRKIYDSATKKYVDPTLFQRSGTAIEGHRNAINDLRSKFASVKSLMLNKEVAIHPEVAKAILMEFTGRLDGVQKNLNTIAASEGGKFGSVSALDSELGVIRGDIDEIRILLTSVAYPLVRLPSADELKSDIELRAAAMKFPEGSFQRKWLLALIAVRRFDICGFGGPMSSTTHIEFNNDSKGLVDRFFNAKDGNGDPIIYKFNSIYSDDTIFTQMMMWVLENVEPDVIDDPAKVNALVGAMATYFETFKSDADYGSRGHGNSMQASLSEIKFNPFDWQKIMYKNTRSGCGAAMRTGPAGLKFICGDDPVKIRNFLEFVMKSGYITHQSPIGFLGGVATAYNTMLAAQDVPICQWPQRLAKLTCDPRNSDGTPVLDGEGSPVRSVAREAASFVNVGAGQEQNYENDWSVWGKLYENYNNLLNRPDLGEGEFPDTVDGRDSFNIQFCSRIGYLTPDGYPTVRADGSIEGKREGADWKINSKVPANLPGCINPASNGLDAGIISHYAFVRSVYKLLKDRGVPNPAEAARNIRPSELKQILREGGPEVQKQFFLDLVLRACLHGGDSDSTGAIAGYWYSVCVDELGVPEEVLRGVAEKAREERKELEPTIFYGVSRQFLANMPSSSISSVSAAGSDRGGGGG